MSDNVTRSATPPDIICPLCGERYHRSYCPHRTDDIILEVVRQKAEIARLKAALAEAERERDDAQDNAASWRNIARSERIESENWKLNGSEWKRTSGAWQVFSGQMCHERDEARQWARYYQALANSWKKAYEGVWKNNRVTPR